MAKEIDQPRERILVAALELGGDASVRAIGRRAGLHNSSLFHHFRSKAAIRDALTERVLGAAGQVLVAPLDREPPRIEDLLAALGDLAEHLAPRPLEARYLLEGLLGPRSERFREALLRPIWAWLLSAREAGEIRTVRPQPTTLQLMGLVLLEPGFAAGGPGQGLRPASRARRREIEAWVRGTLARR